MGDGPGPREFPLSLGTWNIGGGILGASHRKGAPARLDHHIHHLRRARPDVLCLQEAHAYHDGRPGQAELIARALGAQWRVVRARVARHAHRVLDLWAPLTCWSMLARGDIDGLVGYGIGEIDLYAGALIAAETGLTLREFSGRPFHGRLGADGTRHWLLAGRPDAVDGLEELLSGADRTAGADRPEPADG
ncbi:endonuclease/exonuclease/phosphatase family protein [Kitasatospora sp. NPDC004272]